MFALNYESLESMIERLPSEPDLPVRIERVAGTPDAVVIRVAPDAHASAKAYFASHDVLISGRPVTVKVAIHQLPSRDPSLESVHQRIVGLTVEEASIELGTAWKVVVVDPHGVRTADFVPYRLNVVLSEKGRVVESFRG